MVKADSFCNLLMVPFFNKSEGLGRGPEARDQVLLCNLHIDQVTELGQPLPAGCRVPGRAGCPQICPPIVCHHLWHSTIGPLSHVLVFSVFYPKFNPQRHVVTPHRVSQYLAESQGLKELGHQKGRQSSGKGVRWKVIARRDGRVHRPLLAHALTDLGLQA